MDAFLSDERALEARCRPFLDGTAIPRTAIELMASRYLAHRERNLAYLTRTHDPATRGDYGTELAEGFEWTGLEILRCEAGGPDDERGQVEFVAHFRIDGQDGRHHERSEFRRLGDRWVYVGAIEPPPPSGSSGPPARASSNVGRNDPCPCGSGRKSKRCCGR